MFLGHILDQRRDLAVTSAMAALKVAAKGTFPKKLPERVFGHQIVLQLFYYVQRQPAPEGKSFHALIGLVHLGFGRYGKIALIPGALALGGLFYL